MMPKLRSFTTLAAIVLTLTCLAIPIQAATAATSTDEKNRIELDVTATNATAFLVTFADVTNTAVIVDGYFADRRIDLVGGYDNAAAVFKAAEQQLGATLLLEQGAYLLSHPCTPKARATLPSNAALRNSVSVHFESLDQPSIAIKDIAKQVGEYTVQWQPKINATNPSNAPEISGSMGVHFRNAELKKVLELTSYAAGYTLTVTADRRLELQAVPRNSDCAKPPVSLVKNVELTPESSKDGARRKEYLEYFPIEQMRFTGRATVGGVTSAIVQLDHGSVKRVKVGNYMGENYGRVQAIAPDGVTVREIFKDAEDVWYERIRLAPYRVAIDDSSVKPVTSAIAAQHRADALRFFQQINQEAQAIEAATKAIELEPDHISAYYTRAYARMVSRDFVRAIEDADRVVALDMTSSYSYKLRATVKQAAGQTRSAIADLTKAIKLETDPASRDELKRRQAEYAKSKSD
jgi:tetratricopeptide (TPR) repeat protein